MGKKRSYGGSEDSPDACFGAPGSCLFFSSACPLLLWLAALDLALLLLSDRILFYRVYKVPPAFDHSMAKLTSRLLPWAALLHLFIACWAFSAELVSSQRFDRSDIVGMLEDIGVGHLSNSTAAHWSSQIAASENPVGKRIFGSAVATPVFIALLLVICESAGCA